jgi:hypothetical protein
MVEVGPAPQQCREEQCRLIKYQAQAQDALVIGNDADTAPLVVIWRRYCNGICILLVTPYKRAVLLSTSTRVLASLSTWSFGHD